MPAAGELVSASATRQDKLFLRALLPLESIDIRVERYPNGFKLYLKNRLAATLGALFSGTVYVNGVKYVGQNSSPGLPWVVVPLDGGTPFQSAGPPPNPFPQNQEWYEKSRTAGDIHVVGTR